MSCLLSKLQGEVDNVSLPKIGELILHIENQHTSFKTGNNISIFPNLNVPITVEVIGDGSLSSYGDGRDAFTSKTFLTSILQEYYLYISPGTYDVKFSNKYAMAMQRVPVSCTNKISDFFYVVGSNPTGFGVRSSSALGYSKLKGTLADFTKLKQKLWGVYCDYGQNITGDLTDLLALDNTRLRYLELNTVPKITGDIKVLAHFTNLITATLASQNLTGDLVELFDAMYANGKTSGNCTCNISSWGPTYNGEHPSRMTAYTAQFSESGWTLQE